MTLTYPVINRARRILWLVTGSEKVDALDRLRKGDPSIPAGRVCRGSGGDFRGRLGDREKRRPRRSFSGALAGDRVLAQPEAENPRCTHRASAF